MEFLVHGLFVYGFSATVVALLAARRAHEAEALRLQTESKMGRTKEILLRLREYPRVNGGVPVEVLAESLVREHEELKHSNRVLAENLQYLSNRHNLCPTCGGDCGRLPGCKLDCEEVVLEPLSPSWGPGVPRCQARSPSGKQCVYGGGHEGSHARDDERWSDGVVVDPSRPPCAACGLPSHYVVPSTSRPVCNIACAADLLIHARREQH